MIRVIYKWEVKEEKFEEFKTAWEKATISIRNSTKGARGSTFLRNHKNPVECLTIALWDTYEDWESFWDEESTKDMKNMHSLAKRLSVKSYEEVKDHTI